MNMEAKFEVWTKRQHCHQYIIHLVQLALFSFSRLKYPDSGMGSHLWPRSEWLYPLLDFISESSCINLIIRFQIVFICELHWRWFTFLNWMIHISFLLSAYLHALVVHLVCFFRPYSLQARRNNASKCLRKTLMSI